MSGAYSGLPLFAGRSAAPPAAGDVVQAVSLWEPWASLMRNGSKTLETRDWPLRHRGWLLVCAARRRAKRELEDLLFEPAFQLGLRGLRDLPGHPALPPRGCGAGEEERVEAEDLLFGRAVALVFVYACWGAEEAWRLKPETVEAEAPFGDFSPGRFVWATRDLRVFAPFPVSGHQGLFRVELPAGFSSVALLERLARA